MNIMMIYAKPDDEKKPRFGFSYEMLLIATILREEFNVLIRDYSCEQFEDKELLLDLQNQRISTVLIECDSFALKRSENIKNANAIISSIRKMGEDITIIVYGNQCYISEQDIEGADYTIKENNITKLLSLVYSSNGRTLTKDFVNYDSLPIINREILNDIEYYSENRINTLIQTSRGCENTCVFCQRKGWQSKYEVHSDEYVIREFLDVKSKGYKNVWVVDENFTFNLARSKRILKALIEHELTDSMKLFVSSWANIDYEFLDLAVECNIKVMSFGIESGNREILSFYRKNIDLDRAYEMIKYANSKGIFTVGNFIIGAPMETVDTIQQTFQFIRKCGFDQVNIKTLDYMLGSELYDTMPETLKTTNHVFACRETGLNQFTLQELIGYKNEFLANYYDEHKITLSRKISEYGTPYFLR